MHAENAPICLTLTYYTDLQEDKGHKPASAYLKIVIFTCNTSPQHAHTHAHTLEVPDSHALQSGTSNYCVVFCSMWFYAFL